VVLNPAVCKGKLALVVVIPLTLEFFLDPAVEYVSGDWTSVFAFGLLTDSGGELRLVPRLTWQVGQSLTNREMSSFGTLNTHS
jgi:hypothetical protein